MIAKILNRVDFGGIVNYAHNDKNKKKQANLLGYEGVCVTDNKAIANSLAQGGLSVADGCRCLTKELDMIAC